jgi:hypothetical protein
MRNFYLRGYSLLAYLILLIFSSCKDDSDLAIPPVDTKKYSFVEEFDTVTAAYNRGWRFLNVSELKSNAIWVQGLFNDPDQTGFNAIIPFAAHSGKGTYASAGFIGADFTSTTGAAVTISNWLVSPETPMKNGDKIIFYTRTLLLAEPTGGDSTDYANRLQVRINPTGSLNVGEQSDPGDFKESLLDINPFYKESRTLPATFDPLAYPAKWTRFEATVAGLNGINKGRFAFRYFTEAAGTNGRATAVAIDSVAFVSK